MQAKFLVFATISLMLIKENCFCQDYFPLQIGNKWVYLHLDRPIFEVIEIVDTTRINRNLYYCWREKYLLNSSLVYSSDSFLRKDSSEQVWYAKKETGEEFLSWLRFNVAPGIIGTEYDSLNGLTYTFALLDTGWIQPTPAGIFKHCYYFKTTIEEIFTDFSRWYAPNVGLIRRESEGEGTIFIGGWINGVMYGDTTISGIEYPEDKIMPEKCTLFLNYPNPFGTEQWNLYL